jgi:hypothetical protein
VTFTFNLLLAKYYSGHPIARMRRAEHVARMGDRREAYRVLVGGTEEKSYHFEGLVKVNLSL